MHLKVLDNSIIDHESKVPKYIQIVDFVKNEINTGRLKVGEKLPSIDNLSIDCLISRKTVEMGYDVLKDELIISPVKGKGHYVSKADFSIKFKVLFLVSDFGLYVMEILNSFIDSIGRKANIELLIYYGDAQLLTNSIKEKLGLYDYYVVVPHFKNKVEKNEGFPEEIINTLNFIPKQKLILLGKSPNRLSQQAGIISMDFISGIPRVLKYGIDKIKRYEKIILVHTKETSHPFAQEILKGLTQFCIQHDLEYEMSSVNFKHVKPKSKKLFIVINEIDLVNLIKLCNTKNIDIGIDIGIISYEDSPFKEALGISVISTDSKNIGKEIAGVVLNRNKEIKMNDFKFIDRFSI